MAQIRVTGIEGPTDKGKYSALTVKYDQDGEEKSKPLVSFKNTDVYQMFVKAKAGEAYEVKNEKDGKYWQWTAAKKLDGGTTTTESKPRYYEKDAKTQVSIVRQTCVKAAAAVYTGKDCAAIDVIDMAKEFERYVNGEALTIEPDDMPEIHERGEIL